MGDRRGFAGRTRSGKGALDHDWFEPAIGEAKSLEPEKLRQAILSVKGFAGAEGTYTFDKNGDGLHGYNIVKNNNGTVVFDKHIDFDD